MSGLAKDNLQGHSQASTEQADWNQLSQWRHQALFTIKRASSVRSGNSTKLGEQKPSRRGESQGKLRDGEAHSRKKWGWAIRSEAAEEVKGIGCTFLFEELGLSFPPTPWPPKRKGNLGEKLNKALSNSQFLELKCKTIQGITLTQSFSRVY